MERHVNPASNLACGDRQPSLILYHVLQERTPKQQFVLLQKQSNLPGLRKQGEHNEIAAGPHSKYTAVFWSTTVKTVSTQTVSLERQ